MTLPEGLIPLAKLVQKSVNMYMHRRMGIFWEEADDCCPNIYASHGFQIFRERVKFNGKQHIWGPVRISTQLGDHLGSDVLVSKYRNVTNPWKQWRSVGTFIGGTSF